MSENLKNRIAFKSLSEMIERLPRYCNGGHHIRLEDVLGTIAIWEEKSSEPPMSENLTNEWWQPLWRLAQAVANAPHGTSFKLSAEQAIKETEQLCAKLKSSE